MNRLGLIKSDHQNRTGHRRAENGSVLTFNYMTDILNGAASKDVNEWTREYHAM